MKSLSFTICLLILLFCPFTIFAQITETTLPPTVDEDVVKITTKLVQLDAVVTDKNGNQIKDLTIDDFEILQDGKPQKVTSFSYVNTESPSNSSARTIIKNGKNVILPPPIRIRPENTGRLITFIVDDGNCTASQIGMIASREALEKFVTEQMVPNDMVAIYRTRGGSSLLQQYTSDKNQLMRVVRQIRWYPAIGTCFDRNGNIFESVSEQGTFESNENRRSREELEDTARDNQAVGTLGVVRYVVKGLEKIGGRKVVILLSDGMPVRTRNNSSNQTLEALRDLTDLANRASVVFNTIDARGLVDTSTISASDNVSVSGQIDSGSPLGTARIAANRAAELQNTRDGLFYLAEETGGKFYRDQNLLDVPIRQALNLEKGYYLIGYEPDDNTFKSKNFNKIEIKLKRPQLKVNARSGFLGRTDESLVQKKRTGDSELYDAIVAPLPRAGLNVRLTAFFVSDSAQEKTVRSLVHLDGSQITFVDEQNGSKKAIFDIVAVTMNEKNEVVDEFNRTHTFKVEASAIPFIKKNGMIYTTDVPIKKAGNYNFRLALRDVNSKMIGAASQIVQVPDLKKSKIFLSGLTISAVDNAGKFSAPAAVKPENAFALTGSTDVPAIRRFRNNSIIAYAYTVYNAKTGKTNNQLNLTVQINLYRDGILISEGKAEKLNPENPVDTARFNNYGYLRLNAGVAKGDYAVQVIVKDLSENETTSQWVDFEVVD